MGEPEIVTVGHSTHAMRRFLKIAHLSGDPDARAVAPGDLIGR